MGNLCSSDSQIEVDALPVQDNDQLFTSGSEDEINQAIRRASEKGMLLINFDSADYQNTDMIIKKIEKISKKISKVVLKSINGTGNMINIKSLIEIMQTISTHITTSRFQINFQFYPFKKEEYIEVMDHIKKVQGVNQLEIKLGNLIYKESEYLMDKFPEAIQSHIHLQEINILISFKQLKINKNQFYIFLQAFHHLLDLEYIKLNVETTSYSDIALESLAMLLVLPNLKSLILLFWGIFPDDLISYPENNLGQYSQADHLNKLNNSKVEEIEITSLKSCDTSSFFALIQRLPKIRRLTATIYNQQLSKIKSTRDIYPLIPQIVHLEYLHISANFQGNNEHLTQFLLSIQCLIAEEFYYQSSIPSFHENLRLKLLVDKTFLLVCKYHINFSQYFLGQFEFLNKCSLTKNSVIYSIIKFKQLVASEMLFNPFLIILDLYI